MPHRLSTENSLVGAKQTLKAIQSGQVRLVYLARDADEHVVGPIREQCELKGIDIVEVDSMAELGRVCAIDVGAAVAAILETTSR
ncbi:MAG: 50S ribosomal protein L7Ae-like protein [Firmicutes bacterium]|jgi:large subunit ribosomal protein L7A|nr:50S ribosomal protein L7Ae-like protein [Bacillota bacterium]